MLKNLQNKTRLLFSYYMVQQKTAFSYIPKLILCMLMFTILLTGFAFAGSKLLYKESSNVVKVKIALVTATEVDNPLFDLALHYVRNMDSVESICEFYVLDEEDAYERLKNGELYAVVYLPPKFINNILNGKNTPAEITLHPGSGADSVLFETLASAAAYTLRTAQAGIYSAIDTLNAYELTGSVKQATKDLNDIYIDLALSRSKLFNSKELSATGSLTTKTFYIASASVLLLLFSGIGCAAFYKSNNPFLCKIVNRNGISFLAQIILQGLAISICYFVIFCIPYMLYANIVIETGLLKSIIVYCPILFMLIFSICEFVLLLFRIAKNPQTGILLLFFISVLLLLLSGGIIPKAFLPTAMQKLASILPTTHWLTLAGNLLADNVSTSTLCINVIIAFIFILLNYFATELENR